MSINFSGLSSGIDSSAIIDKLVELEKQPARLLERRNADMGSQLSIVGDLVSKLQALGDAARKLDEAKELRAFSTTSTDDTKVKVGASSTAGVPGTYSFRVNQLATAETSQSAAQLTDLVAGLGGVDITVGSNPTVSVAFGPTDTLGDVASRINENVDGVNASVLFDGSMYRIMVNGEETGEDNAITFVDTGILNLGFDNPGAELVAAQDAEIEVNGVTVTRPDNNFSDVIPGVSLTVQSIHDAGDPDTTVTVDDAPDLVRERVQEFVDAYNEVATLLDGQLSHSGDQRGRDTLFGDNTLRGLRAAMNNIVTSPFDHGAEKTSAGLLGISLQETGSLSIDAAKFDAAVGDDREALEHLFAGDGADGLAAKIDDLVDNYTRAGDGILSAKQTSINNRIDTFADQIERIESRATGLGDRLLRQFTSLEQVMAGFQAQAGFLTGLLIPSR